MLYRSQIPRILLVLFFGLEFSSTACCKHGTDEAGIGKRLPSESMTYVDAITGTKISMLTTSPAKDNKIHQTHPSWTTDQEYIVFTSNRTGSNQYFAVSIQTGMIAQRTDDTRPGNACLSHSKNEMFYVSGRTVWDRDVDAVLRLDSAADKNTFRRKVAELPGGTRLSGTITVDSNGKDIYLGVQCGNSWALMVVDNEAGSFTKIADLDFHVRHCQAHPSISGLIIYC